MAYLQGVIEETDIQITETVFDTIGVTDKKIIENDHFRVIDNPLQPHSIQILGLRYSVLFDCENRIDAEKMFAALEYGTKVSLIIGEKTYIKDAQLEWRSFDQEDHPWLVRNFEIKLNKKLLVPHKQSWHVDVKFSSGLSVKLNNFKQDKAMRIHVFGIQRKDIQ